MAETPRTLKGFRLRIKISWRIVLVSCSKIDLLIWKLYLKLIKISFLTH